MRKKTAATFAIAMLFLGLILISCSQTRVVRNVETTEENGINYSKSGSLFSLNVGTNITRPYKIGEKLSVEFISNEMENVPDLIPINFSIITPNKEKTLLRYWLDIWHGWIVDEIEILEINGLIPDNSSEKKFIGKTTEEGNYTLIFEGGPIFPPNRRVTLSYLALTEIVTTTEYPYILALPFGLAFTVVGVILAFWAVKGYRLRRRKYSERLKSYRNKILRLENFLSFNFKIISN